MKSLAPSAIGSGNGSGGGQAVFPDWLLALLAEPLEERGEPEPGDV